MEALWLIITGCIGDMLVSAEPMEDLK